jgi:hypothetical protein
MDDTFHVLEICVQFINTKFFGRFDIPPRRLVPGGATSSELPTSNSQALAVFSPVKFARVCIL